MTRPFTYTAPSDFVVVVHLIMVRRILDERGLLPAEEFDRLLSKTPASRLTAFS